MQQIKALDLAKPLKNKEGERNVYQYKLLLGYQKTLKKVKHTLDSQGVLCYIISILEEVL